MRTKSGVQPPAPLVILLVAVAGVFGLARSSPAADEAAPAGIVLGIDGPRFTLNDRPAFLLGLSYYAALGAPREFIRQDLDDLEQRQFNWLRVWATCGFYGQQISAVDRDGRPREPFLGRLQWIVEECDRRGLVVDVTLTRDAAASGAGLPDLESHQRAVETLLGALGRHRNWYLDLANERDVRDARFVPADELHRLRELVRSLDPGRLVTASLGGHDLTQADLDECLTVAGLDFISPHRPRDPSSPSQTGPQTQQLRELLRAMKREVPIHYQEPFRRGYERWEPSEDDFFTDLRGARSGGAAGWCLHNGGQRSAPEERPRRSFDLRQQRLFDQLDDVELAVSARAAREMSAAPEQP